MEIKRVVNPKAYGTDDMGQFMTGFLRDSYDITDNFRFLLYAVLLLFLLLIIGRDIQDVGLETYISGFWTHSWMFFFGLCLALVIFGYDARGELKKRRSFPRGQLLYEQGVIWLGKDKNTKALVETGRVYFKDVKKITCTKNVDRHRGVYKSTDYVITVLDRGDATLWSYMGDYNNEHDYPGDGGGRFALIDSLMRHWAKIEYDRVMASTGSFTFKSRRYGEVVVRPGVIERDGISITADNLRYKFDGDDLKINRQSNPTGLLSPNDFSFNFVEMSDGYLFLYVVDKCLGIKRG